MTAARAGRRVLRIPLVLIHLLAGSLVALLVLRPGPGRIISPRPMAIWSRLLCWILGVRIAVTGSPNPGSTLFVANHISWLDIFCIATVCPTHFLAKREVAQWPALGWLSRRVGTAFIDRGGGNGAGEAAAQIIWRLQQGGRMLIFPEGTSTTGESVRKFYPRLFQTGIHAHCPVQAIALRYPGSQGLNAAIPFVGDDSFIAHLWRLLGETSILAELHFHPPLATVGSSRNTLAAQTHRQISETLNGQSASVQWQPIASAALN
jgi:1-acyl-sn-glycerol-3-phosphate acyltransferase